VKTLTVDDYQRVRLPEVEPRAKFAYEKDAEGVIHLRELVTHQRRPAKVRFIKKGGFTVATTDQPITLEVVKKALAEFP
jgi:hypothetical protein